VLILIAYLDEFGHIGPFISRADPKHKTHPAFGLGGIVLPSNKVRAFTTFFFKLKGALLAYEIEQAAVHPAQWEKKGAALFTIKNIEKYRELRNATNRILNWLSKNGGFVFYFGKEKVAGEMTLSSKGLYKSVLRESITRLNAEAETRGKDMLIILDESEEVMRKHLVEQAGYEMFGGDPRRRIVEPPIQAESHLYQTLQCADWICGLLGRLSAYELQPENYADFEPATKYFRERVKGVAVRSSLRRARRR